MTEVGEYLVGAYLKLEIGCDVVDYNVRAPGGGQRGQEEFDVVGLSFADRAAYICEVATHIRGLDYGGYDETVARVRKKHARQRAYAEEFLRDFAHVRYMLWAPVVPVGALTRRLAEIDSLELVITCAYPDRVGELQARAQR